MRFQHYARCTPLPASPARVTTTSPSPSPSRARRRAAGHRAAPARRLRRVAGVRIRTPVPLRVTSTTEVRSRTPATRRTPHQASEMRRAVPIGLIRDNIPLIFRDLPQERHTESDPNEPPLGTAGPVLDCDARRQPEG